MTNLFAFNVPDYEIDVIKYLNNIKKNRNLSKKIVNLIQEDIKNNLSCKGLELKKKEIIIDTKTTLKQIEKKLVENKILYKKSFEEIIERLKNHYNKNKNSNLKVDEYINLKSDYLSRLSGNTTDYENKKIVEEIVKWKKN